MPVNIWNTGQHARSRPNGPFRISLDGESPSENVLSDWDASGGKRRKKKQRTLAPSTYRRSVHYAQLMERHLPIGDVVYKQHPPTRVTIQGPSFPKDIPGLSRVFQGETLREITSKKWLEKEVMGMIVGLVRRIHRVSPVSFLLKHAPLTSLRDACNPHQSPTSRPSKFNADLRLGEFSRLATKSLFKMATAQSHNQAQIAAFQSYLAQHSTETVSLEAIATRPDEVFLFLRSYCAVVFDQDKTFGTNHNRRVFEKYLSRYLRLGIGDQLPIQFMIVEMDLRQMPWLKRVYPDNYDVVAADFFLWFFNNVLNVLINRMFYATDTLFLKSQILFFRREIWCLLGKSAIAEYIKMKLWKPMSKEDMDVFFQFRTFQNAIYKARLMPRKHGLRPIMIGQPSSVHHSTKWDTRMAPKQIRLILAYLMDLYKVRGIGKSSLEEIQASWITFRRNRLQQGRQNGQLYFVTCDVKQAYDQVNCDKLCAILEQLRLKAIRNKINFFYIYDKSKSEVRRPGSRFTLVSQANFKAGFKDDNMGQPDCLEINAVFTQLLKMARPALFQTPDNKWYGFSRGIAQGSRLSGLFLNLYFGQLESELQCSVLGEEYLARWIDDIIFITPSAGRTQQFLAGVVQGFPGLSLHAGQAKTHTNYAHNHPSLLQCSHENVRTLRWYGWYINLDDLSLTADLSRLANFDLRYGATINFGIPVVFRRSLIATLTGKYAPALFDPHCLPRATILQNMCELFILFAISIHHSCKRSAALHRCNANVMWNICEILQRLVGCIMVMLEANGVRDLGRNVVRSLGWDALEAVLAGSVFVSPFSKQTKQCIRGCQKRARMLAVKEDERGELVQASDKFIGHLPPELRFL